MRDIFKLYYYEVVKNRKLFMVSLIISLMYIFFHLYFIFGVSSSSIGLAETNEILSQFIQNKSTPVELKNYLVDVSANSITMGWTLGDSQYGFIYLTLLLSILMSFRIVSRDLSRSTREYFSYICLPVQIYKVKISKIMAGLTLYITTSLFINFSLVVINLFLSIYFKNIYSHNFSDNLYLMLAVLDSNFSSIMFFTFGYVLTCIIGMQTLTSILYMDYERKGVLKKLIYPVVLFASMVLMGIFLVYLIFNRLNSRVLLINNLSLAIILFLIISVGLFILDCKVTKKRLRGGI